jgi:hypothetical protein
MSEMDMDRLPRMKDTLRPEDLDTDACVTLAAEILKGAAGELSSAAVSAARHPSKENLAHLNSCRAFYESDWFKILTCGAVEDGAGVARMIIRRALRGTKVEEAT